MDEKDSRSVNSPLNRKVTLYLHWVQYDWMSEPIYTVYTTRFTDDAEHAFVKSFEVDYTVPEHFDPRPTLIAALETELQLEMAKSEKTCTELRGKIANLLALGQS